MKINKNTDLKQQAFKIKLNKMRSFYKRLSGHYGVIEAIDELIYEIDRTIDFLSWQPRTARRKKVKQ